MENVKLEDAKLISAAEYVTLKEPKFKGQTRVDENDLYWMVFESEGVLYKTLNYIGRDAHDIPLNAAKALAQEGIKMVHRYFTDDEWMVMSGNTIHFEDGCEIFFDEWIAGKEYLLTGWRRFSESS